MSDSPRPLTFGSLFSGIGGIDLGFESVGMECLWQVEIDDYCNRILAKHWPTVPRYGNVKEINGTHLPTPDIICGGFPCQPVSMAGRRKGKSDPRWLWPEFARLVREIRPAFVVVENVPGLYSLGGAEVLADLATMGFDAEWGLVSAREVGAPHIRERVWIVAHSRSARRREDTRGAYEDEGEDEGRPEEEGDLSDRGGEGSRERVVADPDREGLERGDGGESSRPDAPRRRKWKDMADPDRQRPQRLNQPRLSQGLEEPRDQSPRGGTEGEDMAHSNPPRRRNHQQGASGVRVARPRPAEDSPSSDNHRGRRSSSGGAVQEWWAVEPDVGRVAHGVPNRVDRIRTLGNAVVPQVAAVVGERVIRKARELGYV